MIGFIALALAAASPVPDGTPETPVEALADMYMIYGACGKRLNLNPADFDLSTVNPPKLRDFYAYALQTGRDVADRTSLPKCRDRAGEALRTMEDYNLYMRLSVKSPDAFATVLKNCRGLAPGARTSGYLGRSCWFAENTAKAKVEKAPVETESP